MKTIVFLDIDGTLVRGRFIPQSAKEAIWKAQKNGHKIILNTGRSQADVQPFLWDIGFDGYCLSTGAHIILDGEIKEYKTMPLSVIEHIQTACLKRNLTFMLEGSKRLFCHFANKEKLKKAYHLEDDDPWLQLEDPCRTTLEDLEQILVISIHDFTQSPDEIRSFT